MTKEEFIRGLREALAGAPDSVIIENVNYYSQYIDGELRKGRALADIMEELGEPQWIAKSILDACMGNTRASENAGAYEYGRSRGTYEYDAQSGQAYRSEEERKRDFWIREVDLEKWYVKALMIVIPLLFVLIILSICGLFFRASLRILFSPYFWGAFVLLMLFNWFRRR
ncbi:MAG: hypothetical protein HFI93_07720 [Lachnospiraceae bacterium]|nr:hypothetical protein [Lachnospiraceae bacterium]